VKHAQVTTSLKLGLLFSALVFASGCLGAPDGDTEEVERAVAPLSEGATCRDVRIGITNAVDGSAAIKIVAIEYFLDGVWHREDVANVRIAAGSRAVLPPMDIADAEGELLDRFRVHHHVRAPATGPESGWYDAGFQEIVLSDPRPCQRYNAKELDVDKSVPWQ
jgi:hypothetical protein